MPAEPEELVAYLPPAPDLLALAELLSDVIEPGAAPLVLGGVVQERPDHLLLALRPVLEHEGRDAQEMGHVGDVGALAGLVRVDAVGVLDGTIEVLGQSEPGRDVGHDRTLPELTRVPRARSEPCPRV